MDSEANFDDVLHHPERLPGYSYGTPNPGYAAASTLRFDRWVIDACTRPLDQAWLDQQYEIGLRHNGSKKNVTDQTDSTDHIPLRYLLAFTAVVLTTARATWRPATTHPNTLNTCTSPSRNPSCFTSPCGRGLTRAPTSGEASRCEAPILT